MGFDTITEPLPSWNDGPAKQAIIDFVAAVCEEAGHDYVAPADRIAVSGQRVAA